jgi:hypothetical protein
MGALGAVNLKGATRAMVRVHRRSPQRTGEGRATRCQIADRSVVRQRERDDRGSCGDGHVRVLSNMEVIGDAFHSTFIGTFHNGLPSRASAACDRGDRMTMTQIAPTPRTHRALEWRRSAQGVFS